MASLIIYRDPSQLASPPDSRNGNMPGGCSDSVTQFAPDHPMSTGFLPTGDFIPSDLFTLAPDPLNPCNPSFKPAPIPGGKITRFLKYPDGTDSLVPLFSTDQQAIDPRYGFVTPINRSFGTVSKPMPDNTTIGFWGFYDPKGIVITGKGKRKTESFQIGYKFPSDTIRIVEGQVFHGWLGGTPQKARTMHWHGIEPAARDDGAGKLSMEVGGDHICQWLTGTSGTYFYHCHCNAVLHFEMGMYGMLIIDPLGPKDDPLLPPYPMGGPGYVRYKAGLVRYDVEAVWASDDVDSRRHKPGALASGFGSGAGSSLDAQRNPLGQQCTILGQKGLCDFSPDRFFITGVPHPWTRNLPTDSKNPGVAAVVSPGQTLLLRVLCGACGVNRYTIQGLDAEVIAMDGRGLGDYSNDRYDSPLVIPANVPRDLTPGRRFDLLIRPTRKQRGTHLVVVEFKHHITQQTVGIAETYIVVR